MDELLKDFLTETAEQIEAVGTQLVLLERDPSDAAMIASIFRLVHTIKGTCGFLGLNRLGQLAHAAETLIGRIRDGATPTPDAVTVILAAIDRIKAVLAELERTAQEPEGDDEDLVQALELQTAAVAVPARHPPATALETAPPEPANTEPSRPARTAEEPALQVRRPETIRVAVGALERIMLLVSELVLARNQLLELTRRQSDDTIKAPLQRLSGLTSDLQDAVMRARMQPVGRLFSSLPRLVRELASEVGKKIHLVTEGAETELDRQLIELIRDPLTHMIRNCAAHGIETPAERLAAGKPEAGTIRISASHEAGQITINVIDDGRGLDIPRIRQKAIAVGLAGDAEVARMSNDDICRFIFAPGFSTAGAVTSLSGRGVGMDVVRENIEAIGGSISLSSTLGQGTCFSIKIPLTLAIAPALIVQAGGHRFALPQVSVVEAVGLGPGAAHTLERVQGAKVLRLRHEVLPVADLCQLFGLADQANDWDAKLVVVMRVGALSFGILVSAVADVQEIVVKPLGASLAHLSVFSGHTILGDGSVVLILDPAGLAGSLGLQRTSDYNVTAPADLTAPALERTRLILFRAGSDPLKALPLSLVSRIESVASDRLTQSDGTLITMHQGRLMPVVPASPDVALTNNLHPILVVSVGGESMGLLVDEIVDIIEEPLEIQIAGGADDIVGTAEIRGEAVDVLDIMHFIRQARPHAELRGVARRFKILLVDDKLFFRDMLAPVLTSGGYVVTVCASAADALALLQRGIAFDAIVTDTDMPEMDGYRFAEAVHEQPRCGHLPIIALAAHPTAPVLAAARASGISAVAGKFDRRALLDAVRTCLSFKDLANTELEQRVLTEKAA
ncbi:MAG: two-component system, chemotaxis family, sensor kinase CheA [Methylobacteriaceae bacterium]|jgi:two-component system chemotaxis sensor kinase CheA|nr:two-component system, chemotaxis family, sensor kinase CheA [Methylobacteriaceae bacterium]